MKNATLKGAFAVLVALVLSLPAFAQYTSAEAKSIQKSKDLYNKGKYDKAITTIKKVQNAHLYDDDLWQLRCIYEYDRYETQFLKDLIALLNKAAKGNANINTDKMKSSEYYSELLVACYSATLVCGRQEMASLILHEKILEPSVDTAISEDASEQYSKGNEDYNNQNYSSAIRSYEKALKIDSMYYRATNKIAMSYYKDEKYEKAIPYFRKAIRIEPKMLDPRQNLVNSHMKLKQWQEAYNACVDGIIQYPDVRYFIKLEEIAEKLGKTFNRHWMSRDYLPNIVTSATQGPITEEPWSYYRDAKDKISDYCNDDGIIKKSQSLTEMKHLESYSWEFMLKKSDTDNKEFGFARRMQEAGYLDCFAMVSMYHISFNKQYQDFAKNNGDRIRAYFDTHLMK
jgi:tetratricopeptide (TPR) repeat protein